MSVRVPIAFLVLLLLVPQASTKNKKKQVLPEYVLRAQTVAVVIRPQAGEPLTSPNTNRTAQTNVENAITKWGQIQGHHECRGCGLDHRGADGDTRTVQRSAIPRRISARTIRSVIFPTLISRVLRPISLIPAVQP